MILHNCITQIVKHHMLDTKAHQVMKSLQPYIRSVHATIHFNAEGLLLHLGPFLIDEDRKILILSQFMINELTQGLRQAISEPEQPVALSSGMIISALETVNWLRGAAIVDDNITMFWQNGVTELILSLIAAAVAKEEIVDACLHLLWSLFIHERVGKSKEFQEKIPVFTSALHSVTCCTELNNLVLTALRIDSVHGKKVIIGACIVNLYLQRALLIVNNAP